jgi:hypothetical protein
VGAPGTVVAGGAAGQALDRSPEAGQRDSLAGADRCSVAGSATRAGRGRRSTDSSGDGSATAHGRRCRPGCRPKRMRPDSSRGDVNVDSTIRRASQHATGARRDGQAQKEPPVGIRDEPEATARAGPEEASPPRPTWPANRANDRFLRRSPQAREVSAPVHRRSAGHSSPPHRTGPSPSLGGRGAIRPIRPAPTGSVCEGMESGARSPSPPTRSPTANSSERRRSTAKL